MSVERLPMALEVLKTHPRNFTKSFHGTLAWCKQHDLKAEKFNESTLRSAELAIAAGRISKEGDLEPTALAGIARFTELRHNLVAQRQLFHQPVELQKELDREEQFLLTQLGVTIQDGAVKGASAGYFNGFDLPPHDTWLGLVKMSNRIGMDPEITTYLLSWVPTELHALASEGMAADVLKIQSWFNPDEARLLM